jgi:hypothetical protein
VQDAGGIHNRVGARAEIQLNSAGHHGISQHAKHCHLYVTGRNGIVAPHCALMKHNHSPLRHATRSQDATGLSKWDGAKKITQDHAPTKQTRIIRQNATKHKVADGMTQDGAIQKEAVLRQQARVQIVTNMMAISLCVRTNPLLI